MHKDYRADIKSIGRGITCVADLHNNKECYRVLMALSQSVGQTLRLRDRMACGVALEIKDNELTVSSVQCRLTVPTQDSLVLARTAFALLVQRYGWRRPIRAMTVRAIELLPAVSPIQLDMLERQTESRRGTVEDTCDRIRNRYGDAAIGPATVLGQTKMPDGTPKSDAIPAFIFVPYESI